MLANSLNKQTVNAVDAGGSRGNALLITRDNLAGKWAPTWLQHAGLDVQRASTASEAAQIARQTNLSLIIADSGLLASDGTCLLKRLMEISGPMTIVIGLCANQEELDIAVDANASGTFPAPYDWQAITRQCVRLVVARDILDELNSAHETIAAIRERGGKTRTARQREPRSALRTQSPYPTITQISDI